MTIGERIRSMRESLGLTQEELGKKCNTTKQTINKYESGTVTNIPLDRLELLSIHLKTTPEALVGWEHREKEEPAISPVVQEIAGYLKDMSPDQLAQVASYIRFLKSGG